jgi:succinate dehydrogenase hydrophobic anchor subunit
MKKTLFENWNTAAALVIFLLLGLHMTVMHTSALHFLAPHGDDNDGLQNVLFRDRHLFFTLTYILLLAAALYHGLFGLRTMLLERTASPAARRTLTTLLLAVGAALFGLGTWAAIVAHAVALAAGS